MDGRCNQKGCVGPAPNSAGALIGYRTSYAESVGSARNLGRSILDRMHRTVFIIVHGWAAQPETVRNDLHQSCSRRPSWPSLDWCDPSWIGCIAPFAL